ncbi:RBBP9/YdeN family alpha/beta hydrolase [Noviherbaspirillum saxi]|uniref:Alpha/beta hydrolase n=1 Tax=Noviherbaspirillum saxi TaxID=2320863 RepID=A0A3A3FPV1_9BURK|nr:alpha/beta hydrolase [Noviherbaspirillum saxi]RJF97224.1 alpha/beta hydrolase [Noviherbaspirillum saxi]
MTHTILILPGLFNSGEGHWQTLWEAKLPNAHRVLQSDWDSPDRRDWVAALDAAISAADGPVVLAAHSLGCALTAWWASQHRDAAHAGKVAGALLVAPPDVERADFPVFVTGFAPMPRTPLPFPAMVIASSDDPWCALRRAHDWATAWQAKFHDIGARGHINGDSGLGDWPEGREWLGLIARS